MLKLATKQGISSTEGWSFRSYNQFRFKYTDEFNNDFTVARDGFYINKKFGEYIFFDTLRYINNDFEITPLQKELIRTRIREALEFMRIPFEEVPGDPDDVDYSLD